MVSAKRLTWLAAGVGLGLGLASFMASGGASATLTGLFQRSSPAWPEVDAESHLRAAKRQAGDEPSARAAFDRACSASSAPPTAEVALQQLRAAEAAVQQERALHRPDPQRVLVGVVSRACAAHHASRLQPGFSHPVWLHSQMQITGVRPAAAGIEVQARVVNVDGPVRGIRVTFSRGLHHACFTLTDESGLAACAMVDTHPHGNGFDGWAEAHEGPIVATLAGSVSPALVQMPAVVVREIPVFASLQRLR